jgi:hypothetical protein
MGYPPARALLVTARRWGEFSGVVFAFLVCDHFAACQCPTER